MSLVKVQDQIILFGISRQKERASGNFVAIVFVMIAVAVDAGVVAQLVGVGLAVEAEALVGEDARVGAVVRTLPVRAAVFAAVAPPAGMADTDVLNKLHSN